MAGQGEQSWETEWRSRMRHSLPDDYLDAMMDDDYMENFVKATTKLNEKRAVKFKRYERLQCLIFTALLLQAIFGVFIAIWKTLLQPNKVISAKGDLANVDMVLMADASKHSGSLEDSEGQDAMLSQHNAILNLSQFLWKKIEDKRNEVKDKLVDSVSTMQEESTNAIFKLLAPPRDPESMARLKGGYLFIATGLFNAERAPIVHPFTKHFEKHEKRIHTIDRSHYGNSSMYMPALEKCTELMMGQTKNKGDKKYCVIIGDSQGQCDKTEQPEVNDMCSLFPEVCPPGQDTDGSLAESAKEFQRCGDYVNSSFIQSGIELIFVFMAQNEEESNLKLRSPHFRDFIERSTGCHITKNETMVETSSGKRLVTNFVPGENCLRFIMATTYEDMVNKAKQIAELLELNAEHFEEPNQKKDFRYACFLLLPLNLAFFILWGRVINWSNQAYVRYQRQRGIKKKMVKVSKRLVEKPAKRSSVLEKLQANMTEVQLAELSSSRQMVKFNVPMTLRCRLRGGYLHRNDGGTAARIDDDRADGVGGTCFDQNCEWTFEPVDGVEDDPRGVQRGQQTRIKNCNGHYFKVTGNTTGFVEGDPGGDPSFIFCVESLDGREDDDFNRLGDTVVIRPVSNEGTYLRVDKSGKCDGNGARSEPDVQFVVDQGGPVILDGSAVTLRSVASDQALLLATPDGDLVLYDSGEAGRQESLEEQKKESVWSNFLIRKVGREGNEGNAVENSSVAQPLQVRDIVTLRGFNQKLLKVYDGGDSCGCGRQPGASATAASSSDNGGTPSSAEAVAAADDAPGVTSWVVERVGMGLINRKVDNTIRKGMEICLKPHRDSDDLMGLSTYLKLNEDGSFSADGALTSAEVVFVIDVANLYDMVEPLAEAMNSGDAELQIAPLWDKKDIQHYAAMSACWTNEADLVKFTGHVVVASESGTYTVPRRHGDEDFGWVAVVSDKVDVRKAANKAKGQGATGLVVRTDGVFSLEKLAQMSVVGEGAEGPPVLPTMFVDTTIGEKLSEKGFTLKGSEIRRRYLKEAMRALGRATIRVNDHKIIGDVHETFGRAFLWLLEEKAQEPVYEEVVEEVEEQASDSKFKWKVANTNYVRGNKHIKVHHGKKVPPSAQTRVKVCAQTGHVLADDGTHHAKHKEQLRKPMAFQTTNIIDGSEFKAKQFNTALDQVLTTEDARPDKLEQLSEESDFKLEYTFEEIEVAIGEKVENLEEDEEVQDHEGSIVKTVGVPMRHFWIMAVGLIASTLVIVLMLHSLMSEKVEGSRLFGDEDDEEEDEFWVRPPAMQMARAIAARSRAFLS